MRHRCRSNASGFGSLTDFSVTGVRGPEFPPRRFYNRRTPRGIEIIAMSGVIANYHVHSHVVLCDPTRAFGGHLERGCRVLSLAEIAIMRVNGVRLARRLDPVTGQTLLQRMVGRERDGEPNDDGSLVTVERRLARRSHPDVAAARSRPTRRTR